MSPGIRALGVFGAGPPPAARASKTGEVRAWLPKSSDATRHLWNAEGPSL